MPKVVPTSAKTFLRSFFGIEAIISRNSEMPS
jgi:hypothetical protein